MIHFLIRWHLWGLYQAIRWEYLHEILHFISGFCGALLGCWTYFTLARKKGK